MVKGDSEMFKKILSLAFCHLCLVLVPLSSSHWSLFAIVMMFIYYQRLAVAECFFRSNVLFSHLMFIHCIFLFDTF